MSTVPRRPASRTSSWFGPAALATVLAVPLLVSCQGSLEGGPFPAMTGGPGSGGNLGTGGSGSGGSGSGGSGSGGSIGGDCDAPAMIFKDKTLACADASCHGGSYAPNLSVSNLASTLKGMKATSLCEDENMVDPANPMNSVLYKVLVNDDCGGLGQMPLGGTPLTATQLACVADWIAKIP